jgi:putative sterol carrier protein
MAVMAGRLRDAPARFARTRGRQAFEAFVRRSSDERLERIAGSDAGLRLVFAAMTRAYEPDKARGFAGKIEYDLRRSDGRVARWTVRVDRERATARRGPAVAPALTVTMSVADFLRLAARDLDAGRAVLAGRLGLAGDFALAQGLGEMFGRPAAL